MSLKSTMIVLLNKPILAQTRFQIGLLLYLLLAPISYHLLPFMGFYGSDLSMQYLYNTCTNLSAYSANLYQLTGLMCNDAHNLHYAYPVLIYRLFSFTKFFNHFGPFYYFWLGLTTLTIVISPLVWLNNRGTKFFLFCLGIGILSLIQAPSFFALERGGTDVIFLIPWMLAAYFGLKDKWSVAGVFMALAALLKLYPVMAITPILLGLFLEDKKKGQFFKCGFFIALTVAIVFALDWHLWKTFIFDILPNETKHHIGTNAIGHSLIGPFPKLFVYPVMAIFWILYARVFALKTTGYRKLAFSGALVMSTYFNGHSFDYNLITAYPFIYLCFELYLAKESPLKGNQQIMWGILILCFTLLGPANYIFGFFKFTIRIKLLIELLAFALIPLAILKTEFPNKKLKEYFILF